jgi:hypothetical protein
VSDDVWDIPQCGATAVAIRDVVREVGCVLVPELMGSVHGSGHELEAFLGSLSPLMRAGVNLADDVFESQYLYRVIVRNSGRGFRDGFGHVVYSSTAAAFPPHTDGFNLGTPPAYVALICLAPGAGDEGAIQMSRAADIARVCAPHNVSLLKERKFPSAMGPVTLLSDDGAGLLVRFNRRETQRWAQAGQLDDVDEDCLNEFETCAETGPRSSRIILGAGDALFIDNQRCLHSRATISRDSRRTMLRAWWNEWPELHSHD